RGLVSRWVDEEPGLKIVASLRTGREAVEQLLRHNPDVVILDIEMPDLDGLEALPLLLEKKRDLVVIMASTLTRRNAEISLRALSLGAADYVPKPATNREVTTSASFRRELIEKIRQLGGRRRRSAEARARIPEAVLPGGLARPKIALAGAPAAAPSHGHSADFKLRPFALTPPRALLGVVLTGMGSDGTHGAEDVAAAGGSVIAQDEATSVVWGMPGAAANAGICSAVLQLDEIGPKIARLFRGDRS